MSNSTQSLPSSGPISEEHKVITRARRRDRHRHLRGMVEGRQAGPRRRPCLHRARRRDRHRHLRGMVQGRQAGPRRRSCLHRARRRDRHRHLRGMVEGRQAGPRRRPAYILRDAATGTVTREAWYKDGQEVAPPSPVATVQDEIASLAAEFKTAVTTIGEKLEALARKPAQQPSLRHWADFQ